LAHVKPTGPVAAPGFHRCSSCGGDIEDGDKFCGDLAGCTDLKTLPASISQLTRLDEDSRKAALIALPSALGSIHAWVV
jgi:hypothetical protein